MDAEVKTKIDNMSYAQMLYKWRFHALSGDPMFQGEVGDYFAKVMKAKKNAIGNDGHVKTSKAIGWEQ